VAMTDDEQSSVADDAVSNRSDDTAIDEGESAQTNGRERPDDEHLGGSRHAEQSTEAASEHEGAGATDAESGETETAESAPVALPKGPIEETPEAPEDIHMD